MLRFLKGKPWAPWVPWAQASQRLAISSPKSFFKLVHTSQRRVEASQWVVHGCADVGSGQLKAGIGFSEAVQGLSTFRSTGGRADSCFSLFGATA